MRHATCRAPVPYDQKWLHTLLARGRTLDQPPGIYTDSMLTGATGATGAKSCVRHGDVGLNIPSMYHNRIFITTLLSALRNGNIFDSMDHNIDQSILQIDCRQPRKKTILMLYNRYKRLSTRNGKATNLLHCAGPQGVLKDLVWHWCKSNVGEFQWRSPQKKR